MPRRNTATHPSRLVALSPRPLPRHPQRHRAPEAPCHPQPPARTKSCCTAAAQELLQPWPNPDLARTSTTKATSGGLSTATSPPPATAGDRSAASTSSQARGGTRHSQTPSTPPPQDHALLPPRHGSGSPPPTSTAAAQHLLARRRPPALSCDAQRLPPPREVDPSGRAHLPCRLRRPGGPPPPPAPAAAAAMDLWGRGLLARVSAPRGCPRVRPGTGGESSC
jgi:hypothetical protein